MKSSRSAVLTSVAFLSLAACSSGSGEDSSSTGSALDLPTPFHVRSYTVGGVVKFASSAAAGKVFLSGSPGGEAVVDDNVGGPLTVPFTLPTSLASGTSGTLQISDTSGAVSGCTVTDGAFKVTNANVTNLVVTCTAPAATYTVGGTVTFTSSAAAGKVFLFGSPGGEAVVDDNVGGPLTVPFTLPTSLASGTSGTLQISDTSGAVYGCTVTNGAFTVTNANITNLAVTCTTPAATYTVGGTVTFTSSAEAGKVFLFGSEGGEAVVDDNVGGPLTVPFTLPTSLASGTSGTLQISDTSGAVYGCTVTNGAFTVTNANITNLAVTCTTPAATYTVGGTVTFSSNALAGKAFLADSVDGDLVVVNDVAGGPLTVPFTFPTPIAAGTSGTIRMSDTSGGVYGCTVTNGAFTVTNANITNLAVTCSDE